MSKSTARVFFDAPVIGSVEAPKPAGRPTSLTYQEIQKIGAELKEDGFDVRAIVSKRTQYISGGYNHHEMTRPISWGVVIDLKMHVGMQSTPWFPLRVQWVTDGSISEHWPEELVLVHKALSQYEMDQIIKEALAK